MAVTLENKTEASVRLFEQACRLMPGGVSSPVRAFKAVGGTPVFFKKGEGAYLWDEDGNKYLDLCLSWGPLILGHAHPKVMEAVKKAATDGLSFGAPNRYEILLAEKILSAFDFLEQIRFVSSGTEAVMSAVRLARGVTGRKFLVKFVGCYHGHADFLLVKAGSGLATFGISDSAGVPEEFAATTLVLPLGDVEALTEVFEKRGREIAAVIIEGVPANAGLLIQKVGFVRSLWELTQKYGALLIWDEVITGFRNGWGGACHFYDIKPDIVTFGKIIGGGLPVGAYASRKEIMRHLAPEGKVYQAGTLSGNPVAMAAGFATLTELQNGAVYQKIKELGSFWGKGLNQILDGYRAQVVRFGSTFWIFFQAGQTPVRVEEIKAESVQCFAPL
ncbi:MAG: glutamate-1-semialdehyde 2,1-aminomutase, partial [Candidatus Zixiibacteriota bacterium]